MTQIQSRPRTRLLPDPEPREVHYTVISVDDHLVEPADMFEGRLPKRFADRAPRVVVADDGTEPWVYEDEVFPQKGSNAVVGQADRTNCRDPGGFEDMRKGAWDVHERIRDMDINGIWASVNFPSMITGFCGAVFARTKDPALGLAVTQAWNDWMFEGWHGVYPERLVPIGITWLADPKVAAEEILRNADRGFTAVTLPEQPHLLGYPSLHSGHWDPVLQACQETDTVVCLHVGSSGMNPTAPDAANGLSSVMFPVSSLQACADWVWSGVTVRFPELKVNLAEGGIGWVPMLIDRFDFVMDHAGGGGSLGSEGWQGGDISPSETLRRNFWFSTLDDPSILGLRHYIGIDHIMVEADYPHGDSTWPDTQELLYSRFKDLPIDEVKKMTHENAANLFRHPLPTDVKP